MALIYCLDMIWILCVPIYGFDLLFGYDLDPLHPYMALFYCLDMIWILSHPYMLCFIVWI